MAVAKRDFQRVKAAGSTAGEQPSLDLPHLTTPEFQLSGGATVVTRALPAKTGTKKKSANWLVDEMTKKPQPDARDKSQRGRESATDRETTLDDEQKSDDAQAEPAKAVESREAKPAEPALNPLNQYMAGWMTPKDYALLRPGLGGDTAPEAAAGRGDTALAMPGATGPVASGGGMDLGLGLSGNAVPSTGTPAAKENPFLQTFTPPLQSAATFAPSPEPTVSPNAPGVFTAPSEPPPMRPKTPEIARPPDDAKYFKQLKRF